MRVGIADHLGWAVAVTADDEHEVVDRRRIELIEPGVAAAPVEHECQALDDDRATTLLAEVRRSTERATNTAFDGLAADLPSPITVVCLRLWPPDFPDDIAVLRRAPYNARADAVRYRQVRAEVAGARGWDVHLYDARTVVDEAWARVGASTADELLLRPRARRGPPWAKDHRVALAATIVAGG